MRVTDTLDDFPNLEHYSETVVLGGSKATSKSGISLFNNTIGGNNMYRGVFSPKNDVIFKVLFGTNEDILKSFLSDILEIPIETITEIRVLNSELPPNHLDGKVPRLDINLHISNPDRNINIEMQVVKEDDYADRVMYYWSKMYADTLKQGEPYSELNESISINVLNFNMFDAPEYQSSFYVMEGKRHEKLTDKFAIHFFELKKLDKNTDNEDMDPKEAWLQFINSDSKEDLAMFKNSNIPMIQKSVDVVESLSNDKELQEYIRIREKTERDYISSMHNAEKRGLEKGIQQGLEEGKKQSDEEWIAKLKAKGMTDEEIAELLK